MRLSIIPICCLAVVAYAAPFKRSGYAVKNAHPVPQKWQRVGKAPESHTIALRIALKQQSFDELESRLYEVSDPDSATYGEWLDTPEIHTLIAPHETTKDAVHAWLADNGIESFAASPAGDWLYIPMSVKEAERLLDTEYHVYKHVDNGNELVRTPEYSLPAHLHQHIDVVAPTTYFGDTEAMRTSLKFAEVYGKPGCGPESTPPWHGHGGVPGSQPTSVLSATLPPSPANVCNLVSMTAYLEESANISDFHIFLSQQRKDASPDYTFSVDSINGGINMQDPEPPQYYRVRDLEANLDSQTIGGFIYPTQFVVYSTGGSPPFVPDLNTPTDTNEPYLDWVQNLLAQDRSALPNVVSTSYGDDEQSVPNDYATRVCQEFAQLTGRGITLVFSSGDNGVGTNGTCVSNDGSNRATFLPAFPATCPFVTVVGGTRNFQPEIVAYDTRNGYVSGSGISNYFSRPKWQDAAVSAYQNEIGDLHSGLYNTTGRAYPDISAQGFHYVVVYAGVNILLDGTSCSAPTASSVLALVNDALIAAGKPTLGFINPWLYKFGHYAFNDILDGSTWGCDTSGFPAKKGWDLASGWGTPDFQKISQFAVWGPPVASISS
ncbi:hypothetical protein AMS68_004336 [Peltaster fructicola]|uniref:tripeptidyl-peptidase II n=1 Tax=Peltaster fructicola TaxID=286661 RepID=A0A6H0XW27_9PEZI|nr:hypothetical protein AMS68_004336 [Peltaster fructicola]